MHFDIFLHSQKSLAFFVVDCVAQLVEQYTFNVWVLGSSPSAITKRSRSLQVKGFEGFFA
jgi:hypothetical protein